MKLKSLTLGLIVPLLLLVVGIVVFVAMRRPAPPKLPPLGEDRASLLGVMQAAEVGRVRALSELSESLDIQVSGTVVPYREISLAAEVAGRVIEKDASVRSGNLVRKGQVLLKIDPRDYELELARLSQRRDQELAALVELAQDITNTESLIDNARQEVQLAQAEVDRMQNLTRTVASQTEIDRARRSFLTAKNQQLTLQNQLASLRARRERLQLAAKLAETEIEQAQVNLDRTTVRAPVDGRIVSEQVQEDSFVQRGTALLVIEDIEKVEVAASLRMDQLYWILDQNVMSADQLINAAQASRYELPPVPVKLRYQLAGRERLLFEWDGVLDRYDGSGLDAQSRTVPVRILVREPGKFRINGKPAQESTFSGPSALVRGMFVDAILQARPATPLLLVPKMAIKPATFSNQIWKFVPDDTAFDAVKLKKARPAASENARGKKAAEKPSGAGQSAAGSALSTGGEALDPSQWQAGFLQVIEGVLVVGAFTPTKLDQFDGKVASGTGRTSAETRLVDTKSMDSQSDDVRPAEVEYWICEARDGALLPGDKVVVTPLPGIAGDGRDTLRVKQ
jgi:multidrug efflux pump subunit AcrA (membrane-fusion protein)